MTNEYESTLDEQKLDTATAEPLQAGRLYSSKQFKSALGIGWRALNGLLAAGLPHSRFSGRYYFLGDDVIAFFRSLGVKD